MPTTNPRINITLDESHASELNLLAQRENKSMSLLARELIFEALERREDMMLSTLASERDTKNAKRVKHKDVWK